MTAPSTVVFLNDHCHVQGGASRIAIDEAVAVAERGIEVLFLGATGPVGPELRDSRVRTICLEQPELARAAESPAVIWQGLWNGTAARRLAQVLYDRDPRRTLVHVHGFTKSLSSSPVRAAVRAGVPVVVTLHDFFSACPNGNLYNFVTEKPCQITPMSARCVATHCDKRSYLDKLYRVTRSAVQKHAGRLPGGVSHFIGLSRRSIELLRPHLPTGAQVHQLDNIIDVPARPPVKLGAGGAILCVGRLDPEKGIELLLEAAKLAKVSIVFVGDGPLRATIESEGRHRVTGWRSGQDVRAELERARCLVFPSRWYETYGLVVTEAAARGVPAIVSDVSAPSERVRHGRTGLIFPSGDVAALADCLCATADIGGLARLGRSAYEAYWSRPADRTHHVSRLLDIYGEVLKGRAALRESRA